MTLLEAIRARHSVRRYIQRPIEASKLDILRDEIMALNATSCLDIQLVTEEPRAFDGSTAFSYGKFSGVENYIVMAGPRDSRAELQVGLYGEQLVLLAQTLGLNSCWVGLTYKKIPGAFRLRKGDVVHCVIALGYGETQGVQHKLRPLEKLYEADIVPPDWFISAMEAVQLAPSAINQQKYIFLLHRESLVEALPRFSLVGYTEIDIGIAMCHFEIGAGDAHYKWV